MSRPRLIVHLVCLALIGAAPAPLFAQAGPAKAQQIFATLPPSVRIPRLDKEYVATVSMTVLANGTTDAGSVTQSSGNESADATALSYIQVLRFRPALDAAGKPVDSIMTGKITVGGTGDRVALNAKLDGDSATEEGKRIARMTCADYLAEAELIRAASPKQVFTEQQIVYVAAVMYIRDQKVASADHARAMKNGEAVALDALKQCKREGAAGRNLWDDIFKPGMLGS
jgi:TonB family protein